MQLLTRFFALNRRLSLAVEARLPAAFTQHPHTLYRRRVAEAINRRRGQVVLDVGGGKDCPFLPYVDEPEAHVIVAFDFSEEELRCNRRLDNRVVGDAARAGLPFRDASADLVVSRSVVEHIRDNRAYFANCARALRPGGTMIHTFPGRFAPFALINQVLPNWLARRLLGYFFPEWVNCGFVAFYNRCYYSAMKDLVRHNGLDNPHYTFTYYQSLYFIAFFPLYCMMLLYDLFVWSCGIRNLASAIVVTADRPRQSADQRQDSVAASGFAPSRMAPTGDE